MLRNQIGDGLGTLREIRDLNVTENLRGVYRNGLIGVQNLEQVGPHVDVLGHDLQAPGLAALALCRPCVCSLADRQQEQGRQNRYEYLRNFHALFHCVG